ncbi:hypothetical protein DVJ78_02250 [Humibacter sp. BT305]|nr:hypothetical protein DVJ78_02250 [Humibacter sp. BT305]
MRRTLGRFDPADPNMPLGPYGAVGSVFNVVMCGLIAVGTAVGGIAQHQPPLFIVTALACVMEIMFVRVMFRARRRARERDGEPQERR